jgi:hypothetical protein
MKKGVILYVTGVKEGVFSGCGPDLGRVRRCLGVHKIQVATSEDDIADGWWRMVAQGMHQVSCMRARFDPSTRRLDLDGFSLRLSG